jgi:hypothetical protein
MSLIADLPSSASMLSSANLFERSKLKKVNITGTEKYKT